MFNLFKTPEQRREEEMAKKREQKLACRSAIRQMERCENRLGVTLEGCKASIVESMKADRKADALRQVRCYRSVEAMKNKVSAMRTRIQMIMEMQDVSDTMTQFMNNCTGMAGILEGIVNPSKLFSSQMELESTLAKMDQILESTDVLFDGISVSEDMVYSTPEDEQMLQKLVGSVNRADQLRELEELNRQLDDRKKSTK